MLKKLKKNFIRGVQNLTGSHPRFHPQYSADGFAVYGKNLGFMNEPGFAAAWEAVRDFNKPYWPSVPDVRWRMHTCLWAASHGLQKPGDFVELGVNTGLLSSMICRVLDFGSQKNRRFFLCDTFTGIPGAGVSETEKANMERLNAAHFTRDVFDVAKAAFADVPNAVLVRGRLPDSLSNVATSAIAYLSIDLNSADAELRCAEILWPRLVSGAVVVLDDYAFDGHEEQFQAWNAFCAERGLCVLTLPTGQGVILIP